MLRCLMVMKAGKRFRFQKSKTYEWADDSTYIRHPPFFEGIGEPPKPIKNIEQARILAVLGDSVTTDHISSG